MRIRGAQTLYHGLAAGRSRDPFGAVWRLPHPRLLAFILIAFAGMAAVVVPELSLPSMRLVWNASPSLPKGLYLISPAGTLRHGNIVLARAPIEARRLAAARHYIPFDIPLIKQVSGLPGERVCAVGSTITIGGRRVAKRRQLDPSGRLLPEFQGCRRLGKGQYLLLGDTPLSFDGRYFGPSERRDILGRARLLWRR